MNSLRCEMKPYIQPFEATLALEELRTLAGAHAKRMAGPSEPFVMNVETRQSPRYLARRLAYWERVSGNKSYVTNQVLNEATTNVVRNGVPIESVFAQLPFGENVPLPNRRCLRYGPHGIHEYKGKFFPQLVRSLLNAASVRNGSVIADPMCGSGTTLVESVLAGHRALGLDMNPLSAFITKAKCSLLSVAPKELVHIYEETREELMSTREGCRVTTRAYFDQMFPRDQEYLEKWFSSQVLDDLDRIASSVMGQPDGPSKSLLWVSLSNILRKVSWQKNDDLRVRRCIEPDFEADPVREFLDDLGRSVRMVLALRLQVERGRLGTYRVHEEDARNMAQVWGRLQGKVDAVITSPPYATALPYLDTDRLSLIYLQLLSRSEYRSRDCQMIGNREITERLRRLHWEHFQQECHSLTEPIVALINRIDHLNQVSEAGFRRRNLSALLAKYFFDMRKVLLGILSILRPGQPAYVVVGNNHTIANGERVDIETAHLLADLATSVGFNVEKQLSMEMLTSREIFRKNAVASEYILCLRKPPQ